MPRIPRLTTRADPVVIALLAFALRFGIVLFSRGGPTGIYGYDAGVYYSAADAIVHGRVPYRDFVFLHPPMLPLVLTPFAALGRLTTDLTGYVVANVCFNALAAVNAVLVWRIAHRWGLGRRAALFGGLFYAAWWGAMNAEIGIRLEPLGTFFLLLALLMVSGRDEHDRRRAILAGVALGAACCVKIWWIGPLLVVLVWHLVHRPMRRAAAYLVAGAVGTAVVVVGPFLALSGDAFWKRVVTDQVGRHFRTYPWVRIQYIAGLRKAFGKHFSTPLMGLAVLVVAVVFVAAIVVAWRSVEARMATTLLVVQFLVLCTSPSFFNFYSSYLAGPLALTVAAAASPAARLNWRAYVAPAAAALAGLITAGALIHSRGLVEPFPGARFDRATTGLRCVMTDSNSALILMNRLSDDLQHGCPNWVDVTGHTYFGVAKSRGPLRRHNQAWQRLVKHYLLSGDAVLRLRPGTGLNRATKRAIDRYPVLARGDGYVLRRVTR